MADLHPDARASATPGVTLSVHIYVGPGTKFPPMHDPPPGYVVRLTPERLSGVGPWAEGTA